MGRLEHDQKQKKRGKRLAERIKASRSKSLLTQEQLAQRAGISIDTLRKIEGGKVASPSIFLICDLATALKGDIREWLK